MQHRSFRKRAAAAFLSLSLLLPAGLGAQTRVESGFNLFSVQQDIEAGRRMAADADRQLPLVRHAGVNRFVEGIGRRLAAHAPGPRFDYRFRVIDAPDLNAFALPGGFVYINSGVIQAARSEGEVAGVLAHEIAHVALRHGTENASKANIAQTGAGILGALLGRNVGPRTGQLLNVAGGVGISALFLKHNRASETEADVLGAQIMAKAGYSPVEMANFFRTLERNEGRRSTTWLSSHPAPADRYGRIEREGRMIGAPAAGGETRALREAQMALRGDRRGDRDDRRRDDRRRDDGHYERDRRHDDRNRGGRYGRLYRDPAGLFEVDVPSGWQVYDQRRGPVTFAPHGGVIGGRHANEVVLGSIVGHYEARGRASHARATEELIRDIARRSERARVARRAQRVRTSDGDTAIIAELSGYSRATRERERITVVTRELHDGDLLYLLFVTPERESRRFRGVQRAMIDSLTVARWRAW